MYPLKQVTVDSFVVCYQYPCRASGYIHGRKGRGPTPQVRQRGQQEGQRGCRGGMHPSPISGTVAALLIVPLISANFGDRKRSNSLVFANSCAACVLAVGRKPQNDISWLVSICLQLNSGQTGRIGSRQQLAENVLLVSQGVLEVPSDFAGFIYRDIHAAQAM